ncbi:hypothetical protein PRNP1_005144 [Phytophthora ramorum]
MDNRFTVNPFGELTLTDEDRAQLVEIADALVLAKFEEYEEHLNNEKRVDLTRWKKITSSGTTTQYLERKNSNPDSKLPALLMTGPLPGTLDENMFGLVSPTIEAMRIKSSYLDDFSAAAVLATCLVEATSMDTLEAARQQFVYKKPVQPSVYGSSVASDASSDSTLIEITDALIMAKFEEYEEHLNIGKKVDLKRWKKFSKSGPTTSYLERKASSPNSKLPQLLMLC